ncbi:MAG: thermonuclease family protein [Magnetovibrionaceae bacterium]
MSRLSTAIKVVLVIVIMAASATVEAFEADLQPGGEAKVIGVIDGDTVVIAPPIQGATEIRLVGLQAPKLPLGRKGFKPWPMAGEAKQALKALVLGQSVRLGHGGADMDRHGRLLAHLFRSSDGLWVQGRLLRDGLARVYSFPDNRALVGAMLAEETIAREAGRGIWRLGYYGIREATDLDGLSKRRSTFQLVEGLIVDAAEVKGWRYLNFGADWRSDFTIRIGRRDARLFDGDPVDLKGHRVRVRGWLKSRNGPEIQVTHPEQIELLEPVQNR